VELEIAAQQALPGAQQSSGGIVVGRVFVGPGSSANVTTTPPANSSPNAAIPGMNASASASSSLVLPLDTWVTVAESEQLGDDASSSLGGRQSQSTQGRTSLQVRLSVP
jgi:hypothetical protein